MVVAAVILASACSVANRAGTPSLGRVGPSSAPAVGAMRVQSLDRMLVRRGDLAEVVDDLAPPLRRTHSLTESVGG